ncbi:MAG: hypothetical protein EXX96DRAFT_554645 [Benjaminiella poitrasii]|nr:MAG: hypothetical protein EXX96DRAFT_554645 [Benjaminiella poitrasii]
MSIRKQSPYGPFVERVFLPAFRISVLFLALLAIIFGSWLETNDSTNNCSFKNTMSIHQIHLYRNITSNLTTPDSVSFGLWKSCYFYALNCSCSTTNLRYQPDISSILQVAATEHNAVPPITSDSSFIRVVPLMIATISLAIAFLIGLLVANRHGRYLFRKIIVGLLLIALTLIAATFGLTFDTYFKTIKQTCRDPTNTVHCARHLIGTEAIVFGVTLGLVLVSFIFWFIAAAIFKDKTIEEEEDKEESFLTRLFTNKKHRPPSSDHEKPSLPPSSSSAMVSISEDQDELTVWNDIAMFDRGNDSPYYDKYYHSPARQHDYYSMLKEKVSLSPPPPLATNNYQHNKSRVTSKRSNHKPSSTDGPRRYYPARSTRKKSHDSVFTFGETNRTRSNGSQALFDSISAAEAPNYYHSQSRYYGGGGNKTPTSISPHPFHSSNDMMTHGSFCMTPYYEDTNQSFSSGDGGSGHYFQHAGHPDTRPSSAHYDVPILNMPPQGTAAVEHPLNRKIITDKQIQEYLQNSRS